MTTPQSPFPPINILSPMPFASREWDRGAVTVPVTMARLAPVVLPTAAPVRFAVTGNATEVTLAATARGIVEPAHLSAVTVSATVRKLVQIVRLTVGTVRLSAETGSAASSKTALLARLIAVPVLQSAGTAIVTR